MCLSAPASFVASGILALLGGVLVARVKSKRLYPLAMIPLFFAVQQAAEGFVWLSFPGESGIPKNIFLFFALVFWPVWVPFSLWIAEARRKQAMAFLTGMGIILATFLAILISHMVAEPFEKSIRYLLPGLENDFQFDDLALLFYGVATLLPFFISTIKRAWMLGILVTIAAIVIQMVDEVCFVSLWCFFAALMSLGLFYILPRKT